MWNQRASAFSNLFFVAGWDAFSEKVEVEESCNRETQPLVTMSMSRKGLPFLKRLRLRDVETKSLSL